MLMTSYIHAHVGALMNLRVPGGTWITQWYMVSGDAIDQVGFTLVITFLAF